MLGPDQSGAHEKGPASPSSLTIRGDGKISQLPLKRVTELFAQVAQYNDQFSMGSMMARFVMGFLQEQLAEEGGSRRHSLGTEKREQQLVAAQIVLEHDPTLAVMGLSLEPVAGKQAVMITQGEHAGVGELRINVADHTQFTYFLRAVAPEHLQAAPLASSLGNVAQSLAQQLLDNYNLQDPSSEALELFGGMGAILGEYRRLGIPAQRLETYYAHVQKKDLREFLLVERFGLLWQQGEYFGPADWQKDATAEQLRTRWDRAIHAVAFMEANPNAADLRERVLAHLKHCVDLALANLQTLPATSYSDEEKTRLRDVLLDAQINLAAS